MRMTRTPAQSGIPLMDDVPWGSHLCVFYQTHDDLFCVFYHTHDDLFDAAAAYFDARLQSN
jgi:hypothetical protein